MSKMVQFVVSVPERVVLTLSDDGKEMILTTTVGDDPFASELSRSEKEVHTTQTVIKVMTTDTRTRDRLFDNVAKTLMDYCIAQKMGEALANIKEKRINEAKEEIKKMINDVFGKGAAAEHEHCEKCGMCIPEGQRCPNCIPSTVN